MLAVTSQDALDFWVYMSTQYRTQVVLKAEDPAMDWASQALEAAGILPARVFLNHYGTTIGRTIYLHRAPGTWENPWQEIVLCVHEHQHVVQHDRDPVAYEVRYLAEVAARVSYEVEAYRAGMEVDYARRGAVRPPWHVARSLRDYGAGQTDQEIAQAQLEASAEMLFRGAPASTEAARVGLAWLQGRGLVG